jgi:hypothetical protein
MERSGLTVATWMTFGSRKVKLAVVPKIVGGRLVRT